MMDDERIERALREGPPGETRYEVGRLGRTLAAGSSVSARPRRSPNVLSGVLRVAAVGLVAVLIVVGLEALRSANSTQVPIPGATAPPASLVPSASPPLATSGATAAPTESTTPTLSISPPPLASAPASSAAAIAATGNAAAVAVGVYHTCVLTLAGGVKCWGFNNAGQLGNGSNVLSATPVDVVGLSSGVRAIAAAALQTCALTTGGGVKCWGNNTYGQLGTGDYHNSSVPVDVAGLANGIVAISVGDGHICVVTAGGGVKCWGGYCGCEGIGVLGNGTQVDSATPVDVTGLKSGVTALAAGKNHTCALKDDGTVTCWGDNAQGQLGDGTTTPGVVPVPVVGLTGTVTSIAAGGDRTCAIAGGSVVCWGAGAVRGTAGTTSSSRPVPVTGLGGGIARLALSAQNSCAIDAAGGATCWGPNEHGQLGDGSRSTRVTPVSVLGLAGPLSAIAVSDGHTCAVTTGGALECWGSNADGQLGADVPKGLGSPTPVVVSGL